MRGVWLRRLLWRPSFCTLLKANGWSEKYQTQVNACYNSEKDQGSPFPRYTSLLPNYILFACLMSPIGVLEPFLLFLNPVKTSSKVIVSPQTRISSILGSARVNFFEIVLCYILISWNDNLKKKKKYSLFSVQLNLASLLSSKFIKF